MNTSYNINQKALGLQLTNGSVFLYKNGTLETFTTENGDKFKFPQICSSFSLCSSPNNPNKV